MQQKSIIAVLVRGDAVSETLINVFLWIETALPRLGGERGIGDGKIKSLCNRSGG